MAVDCANIIPICSFRKGRGLFSHENKPFQCSFWEMSYSKRLAVLRLRLALWTTEVTALALRKRAVRAAVVVVAWLAPHETFKSLMIAIGKIHGIPPFDVD